jgi:osmotically-inducible protein OsmY
MRFQFGDLMRKMRLMLRLGVVTMLATTSFVGCHRESPERTPAERQQDEKLVQQVKATFNNSPSFKFPDVQVTAYKGTVQLSGFVVSEDQKLSVEKLAKGVPGIVTVENRISLKH